MIRISMKFPDNSVTLIGTAKDASDVIREFKNTPIIVTLSADLPELEVIS